MQISILFCYEMEPILPTEGNGISWGVGTSGRQRDLLNKSLPGRRYGYFLEIHHQKFKHLVVVLEISQC